LAITPERQDVWLTSPQFGDRVHKIRLPLKKTLHSFPVTERHRLEDVECRKLMFRRLLA